MTEESHELSELVTLGEFSEPIEAEMVKLRLESAGIETFLSGENAAMLAPGLGPLHLQVSPEDEVDARSILADVGQPGAVRPVAPLHSESSNSQSDTSSSGDPE